MGLKRLFVATLMLVGLLAAPGHAQTVDFLRQGDLVRVYPNFAQRTTGRLIDVDNELIRINGPNHVPLNLALDDLRRLEIGIQKEPAQGAKDGLKIGFIGGLVVGGAMSLLGAGGGGASLAIIGVPLVTAPLGALVGASQPGYRFVDVELPGR